jgi:hypothetical protein
MGLFGFGKKKVPEKKKTFRLQAHEIKEIAKGYGGCIASDRITVDGLKVGYMYREPSDGLSGWIFLSGEEKQEYLDDPRHMGIYEVNTIANYDPEIVPHLRAPMGSAFARKDGGKLLPEGASPSEESSRDEPMLRPLTKQWSIYLNSSFKARMDGETLVFFAPGRTVLVSVWDNPKGKSPEERLKELKKIANPAPVERYDPAHPSMSRFAYLLLESDDKMGTRWALNAFTLAVSGEIHIAAYFDDKADLDWALSTWESVEYKD